MKRSSAVAWAIFSVLLTTGCAVVPDPEPPPPGSAALRQGYLDGCAAGYARAGRDGYQGRYIAYRGDVFAADYQQGWEDGHRACYEAEKRAPRLMPGPHA